MVQFVCLIISLQYHHPHYYECSIRGSGEQTMRPWIILRGTGIQVDPNEAAELDKLGM